jgi:hypothetical protein
MKLLRSYVHARVSLQFCLVLICLGVVTAQGQELVKTSVETTKVPTETAVSERVRLLEGELERQNTKLELLQKTIEDQQQAIQTLMSKLSADKTPIQNAKGSIIADAETIPPASTSNGEPQTPSLEQRVAKVEGQVLKAGPFRLSGDFRLRMDATFRSASEPPNPALAHLQNVRARYRLRLNFDTDLYPKLSFHGQLATGAINNPLTVDQDFGSTTVRHPFFINEAWIDYHPTTALSLQAGRVQEVFADNSRFLFDDDIRFNGFNEKYAASLRKNAGYLTSIELRAGQYILTNPNVAVIAPGSPLAHAGQIVGTAGRSANLFHQGVIFNQQFNKKWGDQFGGDIQLYRNPNQIQLASTTEGLVLLVQPGLGLALSGPLTGTGNATTTPGGAIYSARGFQIARLTYRLNYAGFKHGDHLYPLVFNAQLARNVGTGLNERDAMLAAVQLGRITKRGDSSFLYVFSIKGANSLISQVTDDDLGTGTGVNIRTNHFRFEYGIAKKVTLQSLFYFQRELRNSGQFPNFFVPLGAFAPRTYRIQQQLVFSF